MKKPPAKGAIAWEPLSDESDVKVGIVYQGNRKAKEWSVRLGRYRLQDISRLEKMRKGKRKDEVPELWELSFHPDSVIPAIDLVNEILGEAVAGVRGVDGIDEKDKEAAGELLSELDIDEGMGLVNRCIELQSLSKAERFST